MVYRIKRLSNNLFFIIENENNIWFRAKYLYSFLTHKKKNLYKEVQSVNKKYYKNLPFEAQLEIASVVRNEHPNTLYINDQGLNQYLVHKFNKITEKKKKFILEFFIKIKGYDKNVFCVFDFLYKNKIYLSNYDLFIDLWFFEYYNKNMICDN